MNKFLLVRTERQGHLAAELTGGVSKPRHTPKQGFGLNYLKEFLEFLQLEHQAAQVYRASPYSFKHTTLKMIKWCLERDLIQQRKQYKSRFSSRKRPKVFYLITDEGRQLLRLIR